MLIPHNPKVVGSNPAAATIIAPNEWYNRWVHFYCKKAEKQGIFGLS